VTDPVAVPYLREMIKHDRSSGGFIALERIATNEAREALEEFYHGSDQELAAMALDSLRRMGGAQVR
jgi:hypothetical protein